MIYIFLFIASFVLTYFIKEYSIKRSLLDIPNERSSHSVATPHGGGIAIALSWFFGISYLYFTNAIESSLYFALLVGAVISVVSYIDDIYHLSAKIRLVAQAGVALGGLYFLGGLTHIDLGIVTIENHFLTNIIAFFIIVWFINLYNFLDGIDGYAGSEAIFLALAGFLLFGNDVFVLLAASVGGFLVWNWDKAKIFMGDVGSTLLGYNVAVFSLYYQNEGTSILVWFILFGVFFFDATLTLLRRFKNGEKLSEAHKKHAYQRLTQSGWSHEKVVLFSIALNCVLFFLLYMSANVFIAALLAVILLYSVIKYVDTKKAFE